MFCTHVGTPGSRGMQGLHISGGGGRARSILRYRGCLLSGAQWASRGLTDMSDSDIYRLNWQALYRRWIHCLM